MDQCVFGGLCILLAARQTIKRAWLYIDFQFLGNLHNEPVEFARMHIIANKVNINRQNFKKCYD
jgi:hypothetical protein